MVIIQPYYQKTREVNEDGYKNNTTDIDNTTDMTEPLTLIENFYLAETLRAETLNWVSKIKTNFLTELRKFWLNIQEIRKAKHKK